MNNRRRVGPKTEPYGTVPHTTTNCVRLWRKAAIQASVFPLMPQWANFCSNLVWETLSKDFGNPTGGHQLGHDDLRCWPNHETSE